MLQTLLTVVVIRTVSLDPRGQFVVYGGYFLVLAAIYAVTGIASALFIKRTSTD